MSGNIDVGAGDSDMQDQEEKSGEPSTKGRANRLLLFKACTINRDDKMGRLLIPKELALDHFPSLDNCCYTYAARIKITTPRNFSSIVTVSFNVTENAFAIEGQWWQEYVIRRNNLRPMDVIGFYRPVPAAHKHHFLVDFVRRTNQRIMRMPEFKPQNFLFQLNFTNIASKTRMIYIPREIAVRNHFRVVGIPAGNFGLVRLHFTDARNNDWPVKMMIAIPTPTAQLYMLKFSEKFVMENNLEDGDLIRFYIPVQQLHSRHFLIEFVKGGGQMLELSQVSGTAWNNGNGNCGTDRSRSSRNKDEGIGRRTIDKGIDVGQVAEQFYDQCDYLKAREGRSRSVVVYRYRGHCFGIF